MLLFVIAQDAAATVASTAAQPPAGPSSAPPPVTVIAAREGITTYTPDFFADNRPANALDMIQRIPGFSLDTGDNVRGYEGAAGNVLIDGQRPATKADTLDQLLYRMPASAVDHIDVIRGGAPGIDMQGKTVIANVVRKAGGAFHGLLAFDTLSLSDGRGYGSVRAEGSGKVGDHAWEGAVSVGEGFDGGYGRGSVKELDPNGVPLELGHIHAQGEAFQLIANGALEQPLWGGSLRINGHLQNQPYNSNETDSFTAPDPHLQTEHQDENTLQTELGGRYSHSLGPRASLETVLLRQDRSERYADNFQAPGDAELFHLNDTTAESIVSTVVKYQQTPKLSWEGGAEAAYNTLDSQTRFSENGAPVAIPAADVTVQEKRGEMFGKGVWQATPTITLEGALREEGSNIASSGDVTQEKSLYYTKPRVLVTWSPNADTQVRFRLERVVGQLDFGAFVASTSPSTGTVSVGNPDLVPEQDWVTEAAFERHFWTKGSLVLTLRHTQITDAVDRAPIFAPDGSIFDAPANIGDGSRDDESVSLTVPLDKLGIKGAQIQTSATLRQSAVIDPTTHQQRDITGLHPIDWEWHFMQDLPAHKLNWEVDVSGAARERYFRFNQVDTRKYGAFVSAFVEWKPRPDLAWRFEVDNVLQRDFKRIVEQYDGPRNSAPLDSTLVRNQYTATVFDILLRKTFGN